MNDNFAAFILTHGRPGNVKTYDTLIKCGYTGKIYIIIDNEDKTADEYRKRFKDKVVVFDKLAISKTFDTGNNFDDRRAVVYARNACWQIAKDLGIDYFLQLDDDYTTFEYKFSPTLLFKQKVVKDLDRLFSITLDYYKSIDAVSIAYAQGGDLFGGGKSTNLKKLWLKRKCMNTWFCDTSKPFAFVGSMNEDFSTSVIIGNRGGLLFTMFNVAINQLATQAASGGMSELYLDSGTYLKSFYTVMYAPSCTKVYMMGGYGETAHKRLHHKVSWENAVPCVISESHKKAEINA